MVDKIGDNAGKVWKALHGNGPISFTKVAKAAKLNQREVDRALGWLAREGKIVIEKKKTGEVIMLLEE